MRRQRLSSLPTQTCTIGMANPYVLGRLECEALADIITGAKRAIAHNPEVKQRGRSGRFRDAPGP